MQESIRNVPPHFVPLWQICDLSLTFISTFPLYRESPDNNQNEPSPSKRNIDQHECGLAVRQCLFCPYKNL